MAQRDRRHRLLEEVGQDLRDRALVVLGVVHLDHGAMASREECRDIGAALEVCERGFRGQWLHEARVIGLEHACSWSKG